MSPQEAEALASLLAAQEALARALADRRRAELEAVHGTERAAAMRAVERDGPIDTYAERAEALVDDNPYNDACVDGRRPRDLERER